MKACCFRVLDCLEFLSPCLGSCEKGRHKCCFSKQKIVIGKLCIQALHHRHPLRRITTAHMFGVGNRFSALVDVASLKGLLVVFPLHQTRATAGRTHLHHSTSTVSTYKHVKTPGKKSNIRKSARKLPENKQNHPKQSMFFFFKKAGKPLEEPKVFHASARCQSFFPRADPTWNQIQRPVLPKEQG